MGADAVKYVTEISKGVNMAQLTTGDETVDDSGPFRTGVAAGKQPVLTTDGYGAEDPLGQVVVYVEVAILDVPIQSLAVTRGSPCAGQNMAQISLDKELIDLYNSNPTE